MYRIEHSKPYDTKKLGTLIAIGGEHIVRKYDTDRVIKFPFGPRYIFDPHKYCENVARDEEVAKKYFSDYLIERTVFFYPRRGKPSYIIIEPFVRGRHLKRADLRSPSLRRQFTEIIKCNNIMSQREDLCFDIFGIWGLLWHGKYETANIMHDYSQERLMVVDPSVMHFGKHKDQQILVAGVTNWACKQQQKLLKKYWLNI